jgi:hypothetical protein
MEEAERLFPFQDPGKSGAEKSGVVSHTNEDDSAKRMRCILDDLDLDWKRTVSWNSIPWTDRGKKDLDQVIDEGLVPMLLRCLPNLKVVVLFGCTVAWKLQGEIEDYNKDYDKDLKILWAPHPSNKGIIPKNGLTREQHILWLWTVVRVAKKYSVPA